MQFDILTTFPNSFSNLNESIIKRAQQNNLIQINIHDLRQWATDKHKTTDDSPFGGGPGMLMKIEPIYKALKALKVYPKINPKVRIILTSAAGLLWNQNKAQEYSLNIERLIIICGHYEGVDHRVAEFLADEEISIGKYVLSGGEIPAMVMLDSVSRLLIGVLGNKSSLNEESYNEDGLEYPQYTRPNLFQSDEGDEWKVPDILISGNHSKIKEWRDCNKFSL